MIWFLLVPFHKGNGTGGTHGTNCPDNADVFVPSVPLVPRKGWNGTEQDSDSGRYFCSACSAQGVERNRTRSMCLPIDTSAPQPL